MCTRMAREARFHDADLELTRRSPHICVAEGLRSATRMITRIYGDHLAPSGIGQSQFSLLMRLYFTGSVKMTMLAEKMETDRTGLTRNLAILGRLGLVETKAEGRTRLVSLTEAGFAKLVEARPLWDEAQREVRAKVGDDMWGNLLRSTRVVAELNRTN